MTHEITCRVYYEDTDAGGVVYHANHLQFCERGRTEYLRKLGFLNSDLMSENGVLFVVRRVEAEYFRPARLDDTLAIKTALQTVKNTSFIMKQDIMRGDDHLFSMTVLLVCVNRNGKPVGIPAAIKDAFNNHI
jgi:acyl-CoA thioester hydrolase